MLLVGSWRAWWGEERNTNGLSQLLQRVVTGGEPQAESHGRFEMGRIVSGELVAAGQGKERTQTVSEVADSWVVNFGAGCCRLA